MGEVYLIGAGPGDPGLLTLRGKALLQRADVVVYDYLAGEALLAYARPDAERIYVGKQAGRHALPQDGINRLLVDKAREGKTVARLKGGDPYIFGRGGEEAEILVEAGIPFEEVPGISSTIAGPAYAGIPLTHRDFASSVTLVTGHERPDKPGSVHNWKALAAGANTLVFVMGMKNLPDIAANLMGAGLAPDTPAALVHWGTTPRHKSLVSTLEKLPAQAVDKGFTNPSVIVVGKVAALRDRLNWFERKPLLGRVVVVTRAREQASGLAGRLAEAGAEVIQFPTIEIRPLPDYAEVDAAIGELGTYHWLIFTSANGVEAFWSRLAAAGLDSRALGGRLVAAIGPATGAALERRGIRPDFLPEAYVAESVAAGLIALAGGDLRGKRVLIPRAKQAREVLPETLAGAGAEVRVLPVYETAPAAAGLDEVLAALGEGRLSCVTFGSSSTVINFFARIPAETLRGHPEVKLACIGPVTAKTLRGYGLDCHIRPAAYTVPALADAIVKEYRP